MFSIRARIREEMKTVVSPSETVTLMIRQSLWHSISPSALVLTDRRLVLVHHSFWGLYTKINLISPTEINIVQHMNIMSVAIGRGLIFGTVRLRVHGYVEPTKAIKYEWDLDGIWIKDVLKITTEVGRVIEERSEAQDAKISPTNKREGSNEEENSVRSEAALNESYRSTTSQRHEKEASKGPASEDGSKKAADNGYDEPIAYVVKNDKIVATEKIAVPLKNSKIYGRAFGAFLALIGIIGIFSAFDASSLSLILVHDYLSVVNSIFLIVIGTLLIKLA